jgi:hypothetical protein
MSRRAIAVVAALAALPMLLCGERVVAQEALIQRAGWLAGCWAFTDGDRTVEEHWMAPRGDAMIATGRTVQSGKLTSYELVILREDGGRLAYEAHPAGQAVTVFRSTAVTASSVVFENLEHDFPQRVGYERNGDALNAYIEGPVGGRTRRMEFPYRRVACTEP